MTSGGFHMYAFVTFARRAALIAAVSAALTSMAAAQSAPKPVPAGGAAAGAAKAAPAGSASKAPAALDAPGKGTADRYLATAAALPGIAGETLTIDLLRWSTDAERDKLMATLKDKGDKDLGAALAAAPSLGYIWRSGSGFGTFVRYATRFKAADGEHVVLVTDADLSAWVAKPGAPPAAAKPYAVIELSLAAAAPTGKTSLAGKVIADADAKSIRLEDFKTAPAALKGVKHIKGGV